MIDGAHSARTPRAAEPGVAHRAFRLRALAVDPFRFDEPVFFFAVVAFRADGFRLPLRFGFVALFRPTRSGRFALPVSRFHSSNVSGEIFPSTRSCANLRRCAWLLNGMVHNHSRPEIRE